MLVNHSTLIQFLFLHELARTHRLVAQSDDVRDRASTTVLHDNPQVRVLEVAAIVLYDIRAEEKRHNFVKRQQCHN